MSMDQQNGLVVGDRAEGIVLPRLDQGTVNIDDYRGKRLVMFMWGSW